MQDVAHPYLAAGVALIGAGAIAMSPVAPPMPDITVPAISSAEVSLSAAVDPIEAYTALFTNTFTNLQTLIDAELANPAPVLQQVIANQISSVQGLVAGLQGAGAGMAEILDPNNPYGIPATLQLAFENLLAGDINGAVANTWGALLSPVLYAGLPLLTPITAAIRQPIQNLLNVVDTQTAIIFPVLGLINVGYGTVTAAGNVGQAIVDSIREGDPLGVASALVSSPAVIANAILNGDETGGGILGPGLGLLSTLRQARELIAAAITPPPPAEEEAPAAANATLASASKVVTLDVTPKAAAATPVAAAVAAPAAADETVTAAEDAADAAPGAGTPVVKESIKAEPGKTLSTKRPTSVKQVREGVQGAVKNLTDGIKKATEGLGGKSTKAGKHAKSSGGSSSSGSSSASSSGAA
ncbi:MULTISPECIES: hypothetical protein [Mycolicibacterium]|uniref:hypothetical protein n=1 Tax=Mycolicibacterium TaxID=1866885 RepID=UPI00069BE738|nr:MULTISPECIES: hypothetical protein [Mycolicibacterium]OBK05385.1 hypothetical protein A5639_18885 [Mycolicibacterium conceptionense]OMB83345.1 hypothetical protein A5746_30175 [Mycolicibacterium conceptionense]OMB85493.1 hypothetical protein A5741_18605 [Mycolicibacterium conceptionense]